VPDGISTVGDVVMADDVTVVDEWTGRDAAGEGPT
jgi:hypothetical protein